MKPAIPALFVVLVLLAPLPARAAGPDLSPFRPALEKRIVSAPPASALRFPGDTADDPFFVPEIPFADLGSTCGFTDDYNVACPYNDAGSPDVVYRFDCDTYDMLYVGLCMSSYDTKLYVYENTIAPGSLIACNDDACGYQSEIEYVEFEPGLTYFIVVDGYGGDCGDYELEIHWTWPCLVFCDDPDLIPEGEPDCYDGYVDPFNGGCGSNPTAFGTVPPEAPVWICGKSGTFLFDGLPYRDTDWYEITPAETIPLWINAYAEFAPQVVLLDGNQGCSGYPILDWDTAGACHDVILKRTVPPGRYWIWVAPRDFEGVDCGSVYHLGIDGYDAAIVTGVADGGAPQSLPAVQAAPNPFNPSTRIVFTLPEAGRAKLSAYDLRGRLAAVIADGSFAAGTHEARWEGAGASGRHVPPGVYFIRLEGNGASASCRVVILK